jgi:hypothetical protein
MKRRITKGLSVALAIAMCTSLFTGCSLFGPKNATELVKKSHDVMSELDENFRMEMLLDCDIKLTSSVDGADLKLTVPMEMKFNMDVCGDYSHGNMDLESVMKYEAEYDGEKESDSEDISESSEIYYVVKDDETLVYTKTDGEWSLETEDNDSEDNVMDLLDTDEIFVDAEMEKVDDGYIVSTKLSTMLKNDSFSKLIEDEDTFEEFGEAIDMDEFEKIAEEIAVVYQFDKNYRLTKISMDKIKLDLMKLITDDAAEDFEFDLDDAEFSLEMSMSIEFSKFGEIEENDVKVPKKVKDAVGESSEDDEEIESEDDKDVSEDKDSEKDEASEDKEEDKRPVSSNKEISDNWKDLEIIVDGVLYKFPYDYDLLKTNGWELDLVEMGYEDGYILNKGDQLSGTVELYNKKYGASDNFDSFSIWAGFENFGTKAADITECDLWSLEFDICSGWEKYEKYPEVTIAKGITWGATKAEIEAAFGECDDLYESEEYGYVTMEYTYDWQYYMTLTVFEDKGLTCIELSNYGD